ncbi:MAG: hypothetical protein V3S42_04570 [Candidatus Neomarinimicrobiota bacterium]
MKSVDIIAQLYRELPQQTNLFTEELSVTSLTISGSVLTATTSVAHGLSTGDKVNIIGAVQPNAITSLTQINNQATLVTTFDHNVVLNQGIKANGAVQDTFITVSGTSEADYNGTKKVLSIPDRKTIIYQIENDPSSPATGAPVLEEIISGIYNGMQVVTVTGTTTFTYTTPFTINADAIGTILFRKSHRISGSINQDRIEDAYTKQNLDKYWAFVVLDDVIVSKNRAVTSDADSSFKLQDDPRQRVLQNFSVFVAAPSTQEIAGRAVRDTMEDVNVFLAKSLLGFKSTSGFSEEVVSGISFDQHDIAFYNKAFYIHRFQYQTTFDITFSDSIGIGIERAFREIEFDFVDPLGSGTILREAKVPLNLQ